MLAKLGRHTSTVILLSSVFLKRFCSENLLNLPYILLRALAIIRFGFSFCFLTLNGKRNMGLPHRLCSHSYHYLQQLTWAQKNTPHLPARFANRTDHIHSTNTKMGKHIWFEAIGASSRFCGPLGGFPLHSLAFLACAILSVPTESDQCAF